jgi:hypothetical protein
MTNSISVSAGGGASPSSCSDGGPGSQQQPLCSVIGGVAACRRLLTARESCSCALLLANGTHRLNATIELTDADSGLAIVGNGAGATISGAALLSAGAGGGGGGSSAGSSTGSAAAGGGAAAAWQRVRSLGNGTVLWRLAAPDYGPAPPSDTLYVDGKRYGNAFFRRFSPFFRRFSPFFRLCSRCFRLKQDRLPRLARDKNGKVGTKLMRFRRAIQARFPNADPEYLLQEIQILGRFLFESTRFITEKRGDHQPRSNLARVLFIHVYVPRSRYDKFPKGYVTKTPPSIAQEW